MAVWGPGNFENDDARDWADELTEAGDEKTLKVVLELVTSEQELASTECAIAIAAAEIVAGLKGQPSESLPDSVRLWLAHRAKPVSDEVVRLARHAVDRVRHESGLRDLWSEVDDFDRWESGLSSLLTRLERA